MTRCEEITKAGRQCTRQAESYSNGHEWCWQHAPSEQRDQLREEYRKWRKRARKFAKGLEVRIDALSEVSYPGCGFHYDMVRRITNIRRLLARPVPWSIRELVIRSVVYRMALGRLAREVAKAEQYRDKGV